MSDISGLPARKAALQILDAVTRRGETLDIAMPRAVGRMRGADAALARAISAEVLRWMVDLDTLIDSATRQRLPDDAKARMVLRIMLVQALRLETPGHAVVATGLPLLAGGPRRLAHGVFSALMRKNAKLPEAPTLPENVASRWQAAWPDRVDAIAAALASPPPLDLSLREPAEIENWAQRLDAAKAGPATLRLPRGHAVEGLDGFEEGAWWVQDLAASLPASLLGEGQGREALDLCAAPGGKTLQLAAAGWDVTALDISDRRLKLLKENLKRTGLKARSVTADALKWEPDQKFDAILLDAPCTATGTCRRHPDVLHRIFPAQIGELAELQRALIERAATWLKPNGQLVYAVCSLESEEGEEQALWATQSLDLELVPVKAEELPESVSPTAEGWLRTDPGMLADSGGMDGFFAARFTRR
ncbi:RsmB/NOP family class I SAM-dependent RNA methyltransferase [Croceicoccus mobilis]|uniref:rRNA methyltransferase n=1 Tax=Croceicoccus mobilis TaxID=1703339 RepID=A0A916YRN1_9SPHN|nr:methyltransferase domain-containing protein [Croceicoccus mobilis]GGD57801.1 rRNA methyltransferase [Croceicoccus mobilis]